MRNLEMRNTDLRYRVDEWRQEKTRLEEEIHRRRVESECFIFELINFQIRVFTFIYLPLPFS